MSFLLSHWHCILPVAVIGIAMIFMRDKPKKEDDHSNSPSKSLPNQYDRD